MWILCTFCNFFVKIKSWKVYECLCRWRDLKTSYNISNIYHCILGLWDSFRFSIWFICMSKCPMMQIYDFCFVIRTKETSEDVVETTNCWKAFKINLFGLDANHISALYLPERYSLDSAFINVWLVCLACLEWAAVLLCGQRQ